MRATHKKMMSPPVMSTCEGYQCSSSGVRFGPAENRKRPQRAGEPRVERVRIARQFHASRNALRGNAQRFFFVVSATMTSPAGVYQTGS